MTAAGPASPGAVPPGDHQPDEPRYEQHVRAAAGGSVFAVLYGDIHIRAGQPAYLIESFPAQVPQTGPGTDRTADLAPLDAWRDADPPGVSVALAHGLEGRSSERFIAAFAAESVLCGWTVWQGRRVSGPANHSFRAPDGIGRQVLLVVTHAEQWPTDALLLLLQKPVLRTPRRARVLLVCRALGPSWPSLRHRLRKAGIDADTTLALVAANPCGEDPEPPSTTGQDTGGAR